MTTQAEPLLTPKGRKYARYIFLVVLYSQRIPLLGKWIVGGIAGIVFNVILNEGRSEHARIKRAKAQMSKMRSRTSASGRPPTKEVRKVRIPNSGIRNVSGVVRHSTETLREGEKATATTNSAD